MTKLIGFGKCSKYYIYILFTVIIKALKDVLFSFSDIDKRNKEDLLIINPEIFVICRHSLIQNLFRYLSFILGGYIFLKIKNKNNASRQYSLVNNNEADGRREIQLIYIEDHSTDIKKIEIIIIGIIFCVHYELRKLQYLMNFYFLDFWPISIIFIVLFMHVYFKIEVYNFQKCSLYFIVITNLILLIVNTFIPQPRKGNKNEYEIYKETLGNEAYCIFFLFIFVFLYGIISFARVKVKVLTTFKFISNYIIIIVIGICGITLTGIEIIFSETFQCKPQEMQKAFESLCLVNNTRNETYYDELGTFFSDFGKLDSFLDKLWNILLILLFVVICFFEILCELLIIYHLNPIYIFVRNNIYNFCLRIIFVLIIINKYNDPSPYLTPRFYILQSAEILALLGECVYLQLIELKCNNFDKNLNKNIIIRGERESKDISRRINTISEEEKNTNSEIENDLDIQIDKSDSVYD